MSNPPCKTRLNQDELFASRDLRLQDRHESQYPQLMRLCADFNFSVVQLQRKIFSHLTRKIVPSALEFVLAAQDETTHDWYSMTPSLSSLKMLNDYAKRYEIDLLHLHLCGDDDDNQVQEKGFY